ncbi:VOC family protein [Thioalkalivibrio sulfidiphilus]|uniref:VOC family protein n=1 Tax=Thioalkalivibrio sulfidiphilus TaxID=1033854 RepID=UPI0003735AAE|nr:VOC family protein [Thioalkalivibrio sulfidiphilus]
MSSVNRPPATAGMRHLALFVRDLDASEHFYVDLLGMRVEWRPDAENLYLTSGCDNLALHVGEVSGEETRLDHLGFILRRMEDVDPWYAFLKSHGVPMDTAPRTHRDGARSFYCRDPDGNRVQMIWHPPIAGACG